MGWHARWCHSKRRRNSTARVCETMASFRPLSPVEAAEGMMVQWRKPFEWRGLGAPADSKASADPFQNFPEWAALPKVMR
jgi:hypothetical protein